jgi:nucleoid-associated protein YgaU
MPGQFDEPVYPAAPEPPRPPVKPRGSSTADRALPWLLGVLVVLLLAATGGLVTAWVVASLKAAPPPAAVGPTPTIRPVPTPPPTATSVAAATPTVQPLRTPTAAPETTPQPEPFVYVVRRGDTLNEIADRFGVDAADIVALNDISNPNRIREGQELLIPGDAPNRPSPTP